MLTPWPPSTAVRTGAVEGANPPCRSAAASLRAPCKFAANEDGLPDPLCSSDVTRAPNVFTDARMVLLEF